MEYISHEDYKKMLGSFGKEAPKKALNEMHTMEKQDGPREFHKMPADVEEGLEKEGNAFTAGLAKTKKGDHFKVGDKEFTDRTNYDAPIKEGDDAVDAKLTKIAGLYAGKAIKHEEIEKIVNALTSQGHEINVRYVQEFLRNRDVQLDEYQFDQMYPDDPGPFESKNFMDPDEPDFAIAVGEDLENSDLTDEQLKAALEYLENNSYHLQGDFANSHEVGGGSNKAARYIVNLIKQKNQDMDSAVKEFLAKEDDVNWEAVDDEEAEENQTDNGVEEDINLPSSQPTGPSIEEKKNRLAHLSPEERDQLRQYVETIKTVKGEIKKMVGKEDMEESGDTTGLIMKPTTVSEEGGNEHEEIESHLDPKIHDAFHKVSEMAVKELMKAGVAIDHIKSFLQHEISELPEFVSRQYEG